jgi:hypothetical protein
MKLSCIAKSLEGAICQKRSWKKVESLLEQLKNTPDSDSYDDD